MSARENGPQVGAGSEGKIYEWNKGSIPPFLERLVSVY